MRRKRWPLTLILLWGCGSEMPKKNSRHTLHLSSELETILQERSAAFPSINAYIEHCIRLEKAASDQCKTCVDREVSDSVRETFRALGIIPRK